MQYSQHSLIRASPLNVVAIISAVVVDDLFHTGRLVYANYDRSTMYWNFIVHICIMYERFLKLSQ